MFYKTLLCLDSHFFHCQPIQILLLLLKYLLMLMMFVSFYLHLQISYVFNIIYRPTGKYPTLKSTFQKLKQSFSMERVPANGNNFLHSTRSSNGMIILNHSLYGILDFRLFNLLLSEDM